MAILFFGIGLVTFLAGIGTVILSLFMPAPSGFFYFVVGLSTIGSSLMLFAVYAVIDRLDKLVEATKDRSIGARIDPL